MLPFNAGHLHFSKNWIQLPNSLSTADYVHKDVDCSAPGTPTFDCSIWAELKGNNNFPRAPLDFFIVFGLPG